MTVSVTPNASAACEIVVDEMRERLRRSLRQVLGRMAVPGREHEMIRRIHLERPDRVDIPFRAQHQGRVGAIAAGGDEDRAKWNMVGFHQVRYSRKVTRKRP